MKRIGNLWEKIVSFDNLLLAAKKTFRGQKSKHAVAKVYFDLEKEILSLQKALIDGTYTPSPFRVFWIYEPKPRQICAASVRDRITHHAICNLIEPIFERRMISDTYACRNDKGTHKAIQQTQEFSRRFPYFLQCDIR